MHIKVQPMAEETQRACAAVASTSQLQSHVGLIMLAVYALIGAAAFLLARPTWQTTFMIAAIGILAMHLSLRAEARRLGRRAQEGDPHAGEPYEIEVGPEGVRVWCAHVDARYTWDGLTRVVETPEFYLFLRGPGGGPSIPKRLLDAAGNNELRKKIREWSPDRGASLTGTARPTGVRAS
jgi:hypothetical protein